MSLFVLVMLIPLLIPLCIVLRLTGEGEVIFAQERIGRNKKKFYLFKFATMLKDSPYMQGGTITSSDDPRVLKVGKLLRKTKINELPQLYNVIRGEMSLVGPRPLTEKEFNAYADGDKQNILLMVPGLTGLGSVIFRDEESLFRHVKDATVFYRAEIAPYKGRLESWYSNNRSVGTYLAIVYATFIGLFFPRSKVIWRLVRGIPVPPKSLERWISSS